MGEYLYCRACRERVTVTAAQVIALGNLMRASLRSRDCWLLEHIPLRFESRPDSVKHGAQIHELGRTVAEFRAGRLVRQEILMRHGLPQEVCLFALTHEYGHALLNVNGQVNLASEYREGFCQYMGGVVVREHLGHVTATHTLYNKELSRDGVYGEGMRMVTQAVSRRGEAAVIRAFLAGKTASL